MLSSIAKNPPSNLSRSVTASTLCLSKDCRHSDQNAKAEQTPAYTFSVLKSVYRSADGNHDFSSGPDFLITFEEHACPASRERIARL